MAAYPGTGPRRQGPSVTRRALIRALPFLRRTASGASGSARFSKGAKRPGDAPAGLALVLATAFGYLVGVRGLSLAAHDEQVSIREVKFQTRGVFRSGSVRLEEEAPFVPPGDTGNGRIADQVPFVVSMRRDRMLGLVPIQETTIQGMIAA